jgi:hypothetical protein
MANSRPLALAAVLLAAAASAAETPKTFPDGYWERNWGFSQAAVNYQVTLKVADPDAAAAKIEKILVAGGAASTSSNASYNYGGDARRRMRNLQFTGRSDNAEKLTKKLFDLGELQSYNVNRFGGNTPVKDIDERIGYLAGEIESNKEALMKMPVANSMLNSQLAKLKQSKATYEASAAKAIISVNLVSDAPAP